MSIANYKEAMPSNETLLQQAEEWKTKGNQAFQKGDLKEALSAYSQGVVVCDRVVGDGDTKKVGQVKAALLSNRSMCSLKVLSFQPCIDDCTTGLDLDPDAKIRVKLLYRRAKARFLMSSLKQEDSEAKERDSLIQDAAKDLLQLLQADPSNTEATQLLGTIRAMHHKTQSTASVTPVGKTINAIKDAKDDDAELLKQIKLLLGLMDNDLENASMELGRLTNQEIPTLLQIAVANAHQKAGILLLQCISRAAGHPAFVQRYLKNYQKDLQKVITELSTNKQEKSSELIVSALAALVRIILHADRDDPKTPISAETAIDYDAVLQSCVTAMDAFPNDKLILRAVLDVLSTWTCGTEREAAARASLGGSLKADPTLPIPVTAADIQSMTAPELAAHRQRESEKKKRDLAWAYERSMMFCGQQKGQHENRSSGIRTLIRAACSCQDHVVRREITVVLGRILVAVEGDDKDGPGDKIKEIVSPLLADLSKKDLGVVIEEVYNEDEEEAKQAALEEENNVPLEEQMQHALITSALLLSRKEVGAWALGTGWKDSTDELPTLINSENPVAMCLASEVLSGGSTVESARHLIANLISSGSLEKLMMSDDRDIRSGAASAVAKLGLSSKETDEAEHIGLLQAACDLLEDRTEEEAAAASKSDKSSISDRIKKFNSFAGSSVERAIEMLTYLVAQTDVKEELAAGFGAPGSNTSGLDRLVAIADLPAAGESLSGFGLATIFHHMAVTNLKLREESFEGREVTMEAYDEMQKMGKTEEEKELLEAQKDPDTQELCDARIRKMAAANVPRALVTLTENASEHTLEQIVLAMSRMAGEGSARGIMIQQGVLSACIKLEKNEGPTETDTMKKVIRIARHTIAKMLVTTNPSLLTSAQRLGSIRPLIQLVRDIKASDLMHFEALLALTNIASSGDDAQNRIVSERGIGAFTYAMFSDHELVRRAGTEAMCNLIPHKGMMDYLLEDKNLALWLAFASDYEEPHYECARAAAGCLAMATQDESIAVKFVRLEKFTEHMRSLLECGRLEIMYRAMAVVLNLVSLGGSTKEKAVSAGIVAFCDAYVTTYNTEKHGENMEFSEEEKALLPVTVDLAKKIVAVAEQN